MEPESIVGVMGGARVYSVGARVYSSLVILMSPQSQLEFGFRTSLGLGLGLGLGGLDLGLGLDNTDIYVSYYLGQCMRAIEARYPPDMANRAVAAQ